jgi:hypothetical protein
MHSFPRCPRCLDGGHVNLIITPISELSVLLPIPGEVQGDSRVLQCSDCDWIMPVLEESRH